MQYWEGGERVFIEMINRSIKKWEVKDWAESVIELMIISKEQLEEVLHGTLLLGCFNLLYML